MLQIEESCMHAELWVRGVEKTKKLPVRRESAGPAAVTLLNDEGKTETLEKKPPGLGMAEHVEMSPKQAEEVIDTLLTEEDARNAVVYDETLPHTQVDQVFGIADQEPPAPEEGFT